jgi:3-methyl-2-oxobutanoate hydroxymethyltransferase
VTTSSSIKPVTIPALRARKGGEPIVSLTAYTTPMARRLDPYIDLMLVGDSLGMVIYGFDTTLSVTVEMMIAHGAAVVRGAKHACVIVDLPFASYQASPFEAYRTAARVMVETGCAGVKLEGGVEMADTVEFLTKRGIPVLGHVGLMPQSVKATGGYRIRGRDEADADQVLADGEAIAQAGAFGMVVEGTTEPVARELTRRVAVPTIGIGASAACDGQVLVTDDILGLFTDFTPKFVKRYADLGPQIEQAAAAYARDVKTRRFPGDEHTFGQSPRGPKRVSG